MLSGNYVGAVDLVAKALLAASLTAAPGHASQEDASIQSVSVDKIVSTDPPYYDNIGYADLSDFFYVWLRRSLRPIFPDLFATLAVPKAEELVATPYRHGGKEKAETFFLEGMTQAMHRLAEQAHPAFPVTIYYAFKQSETDECRRNDQHRLGDVPRCGDPGRLRHQWHLADANRARQPDDRLGHQCPRLQHHPGLPPARAASRPRATRREFVAALKAELPVALADLQRGNIAPGGPRAGCDRSRHGGLHPLLARCSTRRASRSRCARRWRSSTRPSTKRWPSRRATSTPTAAGRSRGSSSTASTRASSASPRRCRKAKNTSVAGMVEAGILESRRGKCGCLSPVSSIRDWDPTTDPRLPAWEVVHQLIRAPERRRGQRWPSWSPSSGPEAEIARELAYRLYTLCERKKRADEALAPTTVSCRAGRRPSASPRKTPAERSEQGVLFGGA